MSYILNALRKSDQARRGQQTPTIESGIVHPQVPESRSRTWITLLIVIIVILVVAWLFWFYQSRQENITSTAIEPSNQTEQRPDIENVTPPSISQLENPPENPPLKTAKLEQAIKETTESTPSFADMIEQKKSQIANQNKKEQTEEIATLQEMVSSEVNSVDIEAMQDELSDLENQPINSLNDESLTPPTDAQKTNPSQTVVSEATTVTERPIQQKTQTKQAPDMPYLKKMPYSFRRQVPRLNINVYVYDDIKKDRFIMVDMVRYKAGEEIAENLTLKEILSDALVVKYSGKTFKIKRP